MEDEERICHAEEKRESKSMTEVGEGKAVDRLIVLTLYLKITSFFLTSAV